MSIVAHITELAANYAQVPTSNATFRPLKKFKIAHGNRLQTN